MIEMLSFLGRKMGEISGIYYNFDEYDIFITFKKGGVYVEIDLHLQDASLKNLSNYLKEEINYV